MRKVTLSCVLVLGVTGAAAVLGVGCSSDNGGGDDTTDASTDAVADTGKHDATGDTGHPTDSGHDAGQDTGTDDQDSSTDATADATADGSVDASVDGGTDGATDGGVDAADAGHDTGADTGADTGPVDAGSDVVDGGPVDTGVTDTGTIDAADGAIDIDADSDAGLDAAIDTGIDAATPYNFANPLQVDVSSVLDVSTIAMAPAVDAGAITSMDGSGYDFLTAGKGALIGGCKGLPDSAFFAASGTTFPQIQLHWAPTSPAPNSHIAFSGTSFSFPIPAATYTQFQIYGVSTEGASSLKVTITYSDATTNGGKVANFADWFNTNAAGQFSIITGLDRIGSAGCDAASRLGISGVNIIPDPTKIVTKITVQNNGTGRFVFYGATAF